MAPDLSLKALLGTITGGSNSFGILFLNRNQSNNKQDIPAIIVGRNIQREYSMNCRLKASPTIILVGFPMNNVMLQIFAAKNWVIRKGTGLIFVCFEK